MEQINKLEVLLASWYEKAPHLPLQVRTWIADNSWWIAMVGAILQTLVILSGLGLVFVGTLLLAGLGGIAGVTMGIVLFVLTLLWMALLVWTTVLMFQAINPLKTKKERGWKLLFWAFVISGAASVIGSLSRTDIGSLLLGLVGVAISGYVLFEIRPAFMTAPAVAKTDTEAVKVEKKAPKSSAKEEA